MIVRDDEGWLGMTRDDRNWTRDAGTRLGIGSHTPSIWTGETSPHCVGRARTSLGITLRDHDEIRDTMGRVGTQRDELETRAGLD